jgi:phosphoribosylanthranilate isomerase
MTRVKICCMASVEEARLAVRAGASAVGLVSEMPSGPGPIPEELIAEIAAAVPPPVATFLLTCRRDPDAIVAQQRRCRTNTIQLVDRLSVEARAELRRALPGVAIVQVVHVVGSASLDEAREASAHSHALLLDSGNPAAPVPELGGTGRTHDWTIAARIVKESPIPVFLAGGLNPDNVAEAIRTVRPFAVDVCSGLRVDGALDGEKLRRFLDAVAGAA